MFHTISAQNVDSLYRISFADKGNVDFSETSVLYQSTLSGFHPEARTRRALTNKKPLLDSLDQPVAQEYLDSLASRGITPLIIRNWTNSVVAELNEQERASLLSLRFVSSVQAVRKVAYQKFTDEFTDVFPCQPARPGESAASHNLINTTPLHDAGILGQGVRYGLIDCGFRWNNMTSLRHVNVAATHDFIQGDSNVAWQPGERLDQDGHGSIVLSVAAGWLQDTLIGVAPASTYLLAKTENLAYERRIEEEAYCAAVEWLERKGAWVISSSVGYFAFDSTEEASQPWMMTGHTSFAAQALNRAVALGITSVSAAGNSGRKKNSIIIPAEADSVIAVGAATKDRVAWASSSFDTLVSGKTKPDLACLGVGVQSQDPDGIVRPVAGTSMAAPQIGGACALLRELFPDAQSYHIRNALYNSCFVDDSVGNVLGKGIPNITATARTMGDILAPGIGPCALVNREGRQTVLTTVFSRSAQSVVLNVRNSEGVQTIPGEQIDSLWYAFPVPDALFDADTLTAVVLATNQHGVRQYPGNETAFPIVRHGNVVPCGLRLPSAIVSVHYTNNTKNVALVSPNPATPSSWIRISGIQQPNTIRIVQTSTGRVLSEPISQHSGSDWMIQLPWLSNGHYLLMINTKTGLKTLPLVICN